MATSKYKYIVLVLLLALILLRLVNLEADPPLFYVGHGDAQLTDPFHITHFARNATLFGDSNPFEYYRWNIFKASLVSFASYIMFAVFGVSRTVANLSPVLLSVFGILLFIGGLSKEWGKRELLLTGFILLINSTLFYYGRLAFLENGLIFISGLLFFVFARYSRHLWGQLLSGFLIAMAALAGKLFGFILIGPVMIALLYSYRRQVAIPILAVIGGLIGGLVLYIFIIYDGSLSGLLSYYSEQTGGMYGPPPGFGSPIDFFKMLLTYGGESGLWEYTPFIILLTLCSLLVLPLILPRFTKPKEELVPLVLVLGWFVCGLFGLMPFQYRPLRYALFLYLPASAICAYVIGIALDKAKKPQLSLKFSYVTAPLFFLTLWYLLVQAWMFFAPFGGKFKSGVAVMPMAALTSIVVFAIIFFIFNMKKTKIPRRALLIFFSLICVGVLLHQGRYLYRGMMNPSYNLVRYSHELGQALGEDAVLTGPFAATLTIDNNQKNVIYMFGLANVERDLFNKFPITHVAADKGNWEMGQKDFPVLKSAINITQLFTRNSIVNIYRLPTAQTPPTDFETGSFWITRSRPDSAYNYYKRFSADHPDSRMAQKHLAYAALFKGSVDEAVSIIDRIHLDSPDDYLTHEICNYFYGKAFEVTQIQEFKTLEKKHQRIAAELKK